MACPALAKPATPAIPRTGHAGTAWKPLADNRAGRRAHRERRSSRSRDEIKSAPVDAQSEDAHNEHVHAEDAHGPEAHGEEPHGETAAMAAASELMTPAADDAGAPASAGDDRIETDSRDEPPVRWRDDWAEKAPRADTAYEPSIGGENTADVVDLDLGAALSGAEATSESRQIGDTGVDFVLDDPARGSDSTGSTREMPMLQTVSFGCWTAQVHQ